MNVQLTLAWRYLRGRGLRSGLTTLAVALGVMLVFGLGGIVPTMVDTFTRSMMSAAGKIDLTVTHSLAQPFPADVVDRVARIPGVALATGEVEQAAPLPLKRDVPVADQVATVAVVGVDPAVAARVRDLAVTAGRPLAVTDTDVVVPTELKNSSNNVAYAVVPVIREALGVIMYPSTV